MSRLKKRELVSVWLAVSCVVIAAVVVAEWVTPVTPRAEALTEAELVLPEKVAVSRYEPTPFADYTEVLTRPLFFADRRMPPEPQVVAREELPEEPLRLSLEGVAIINDSRVALLRDERGNDLIQLVEGMSHNGWLLETVAPGTAAFRRGAETERLELAASADNKRRRSRR